MVGKSYEYGRFFATLAPLIFRGISMEAANAYLMVLGVATLFVSWILLLVAAWRDDYAWGLFATLLPPVGYLFGFLKLKQAGQALATAGVGLLLVFLAL